MTEYSGMNRKFTPMAQVDGMSEYQCNTRMRVKRELQSRDGMAATNIPGAGTPILSIVTGFVASGGAAVVTQTSGGGGTIAVQGTPQVVPKWTDQILLPPGGGSCTLFPALSDTGSTSKLGQLNPPVDSCQGTIYCQGIEGGSGQGYTPYGYQFSIECFDGAGLIATYNTACLINSNQSFVLPEGTTNVSYDITGGCNGGATPGTWNLQITTP